MIFSDLKSYDSAAHHFKLCLAIQTERYGPQSAEVIESYSALVKSHMAIGNFNKALSYCDTILGSDELSEQIYIATIINELECLQLTGKDIEASKRFRPITYRLLDQMTEDLSLVSSQARKKRIEQYTEHIETLKRIALRFESELRPADKLVELDATLIGINTRTERETRVLVYSSGDPQLIKLYNTVHRQRSNNSGQAISKNISSLKNEQNKSSNYVNTPITTTSYSKTTDPNIDDYHLRKVFAGQENELLEYARKNHPELSVQHDFNVEEIQSRLGRKQVCIFFSQAPLSSSNIEDSTIMLAYIINSLSIDLVTLGSLKDINQVLSNDRVLEKSYNKALYNLLWRELEPYLKKVADVFYCPTNEFVSIPFHALQNERVSILLLTTIYITYGIPLN